MSEQNEDGRSGPPEQGAPQFTGETAGEVTGEVRGYLKAMMSLLSPQPPPTPPQQEAAFQGLRGLVSIARELAKGPDGDPVYVDNAEHLTATYVKKLSAGTSIALWPAVDSEPVPSAGPAPQCPTDKAATEAAVKPRQTLPEEPRAALAKDPSVPAYMLDRREVVRPASPKPLFSTVSDEHLHAWATRSGENNADIKTARVRRDLFIELIGDHPVDTYTGTDLQAFVSSLKYWPASVNERPEGTSAHDIIAANQDLSRKPLSLKSLRNGYVGIIKAMMRFKMTEYDYRDPFAGVRIFYPDTAAKSQSAEPLGADKVSRIFQLGTSGGLLDEAMLPLLGHLTGRRLGLLVHLKGSDIREKYRGVWIAQTNGIIKIGQAWKRVPVKTDASTTFFVLHDLLRQIGFVEWAAARGDEFLFPELMRLEDPSKSASSYMGRLFKKAGAVEKRKEVFHSLRGGNIELMRDNKVDPRDRKLQAGHSLEDEHDLYGFRAIGEKRAREMAHAPLEDDVEYSFFQGLDFDGLAKGKRTLGRRKQV